MSEQKMEQKYTDEEIEQATERICVGGKEAGIEFFRRHSHLGFAIAVDLLCELNRLRAATPPEAMGRGDGWIDCKQGPPPIGESVNVAIVSERSDGIRVVSSFWNGVEWNNILYWQKATHWRPHPAPPSGEQGQPDEPLKCSDCILVKGKSICTMNCGPVLEEDDPLGIKVAQRIARGHAKLTQELLSHPPAVSEAGQGAPVEGEKI